MSDITKIKGKTGVIMGIANDRSIAWGIASVLSKQGANLIFSYPKLLYPYFGEETTHQMI